MGMTIADTIKSLKPGDRVRVTREQIVTVVMPNGRLSVEGGPHINPADPTITSIEVIERPLQVGNPVIAANGVAGSITAIDDTCAIVLVVGKIPHKALINLSSLRRAS